MYVINHEKLKEIVIWMNSEKFYFTARKSIRKKLISFILVACFYSQIIANKKLNYKFPFLYNDHIKDSYWNRKKNSTFFLEKKKNFWIFSKSFHVLWNDNEKVRPGAKQWSRQLIWRDLTLAVLVTLYHDMQFTKHHPKWKLTPD